MLFVPSDEVGGLQSAIRSERSEQSTRIARRRAEEERGDMLFVPERRRSRRTPKRDPQRAERAINTAFRGLAGAAKAGRRIPAASRECRAQVGRHIR
jgi:hypothetical protein